MRAGEDEYGDERSTARADEASQRTAPGAGVDVGERRWLGERLPVQRERILPSRAQVGDRRSAHDDLAQASQS